MKLSQLKQHLDNVSQLNFVEPSGTLVPNYFHITEAVLTTKHFIDCGGAVRIEKYVNFQVWTANDFDHRLAPKKLRSIIGVAETLFNNEDLNVEVEYQTEINNSSATTNKSDKNWQTISRYGLDFNGQNFVFTTKQTDCLAKAHCGIPQEKQKVNLTQLQTAQTACCTAGGGCC